MSAGAEGGSPEAARGSAGGGGPFEAYRGTDEYIASPAICSAVNASLALARPLLVKGEPGTGKTLLARSIAKALGRDLLIWNVKSTTKARDGLYCYDVIRRLNDSRFGDKTVSDIRSYVSLGTLGRAFASERPVVVLIDEVDKADLEFPNDLLHELDEMSFEIPETGDIVKAKHRPAVIITSNAEKELPDAFLRRCVFHYIEFPDAALMERIVRVHLPDLSQNLLRAALEQFYRLRERKGLRKRPSTSELIDWLFVLVRGGVPVEDVTRAVPFLGTLLKSETDYAEVLKGGRFRAN